MGYRDDSVTWWLNISIWVMNWRVNWKVCSLHSIVILSNVRCITQYWMQQCNNNIQCITWQCIVYNKQILNPQQTLHTLPSWASYVVFVVVILETMTILYWGPHFQWVSCPVWVVQYQAGTRSSAVMMLTLLLLHHKNSISPQYIMTWCQIISHADNKGI